MNYKKVLGITLAGLMAVAPMVSSASGNSIGSGGIPEDKVEGTSIIYRDENGNKLSDEVLKNATKAAKLVEALKGDK